MEQVLQYLVIFALQSAAIYAIAASGLVVTYTTSGVFNFAHGAIGMLVAFSYWQMTSERAWNWPPLVGLVIALFVIAPTIGWLLDRVIMRRLTGASTIAGIVATIGLLFAIVQIAGVLWPQDEIRQLPGFFEGRSFTVLDINVTYHRAITLVVAVVVAFGLRALLFGTRLGTAMRAVVDSRELTSLSGRDPGRVSSVAWILGCSLAGLAGILIAPNLSQFSAVTLTLLVIQAYAAAMVGRLRSLPFTFLGALILAELEQVLALTGLRSWAGSWSEEIARLSSAVPILMLLAVLIILPDDRTAAIEKLRFKVPRPSIEKVARVMVGLVAAAAVISQFELFSARTRLDLGTGLALGIVMLSLVLLTGWAGQVSMAQLALGGLAACAVWKMGPVYGLLVGTVLAALVGAVVALPALRMRSLYLALTTMAFAFLIETVIYGNSSVFPQLSAFASGGATARRLPGFASDKAFFVLLAVAFGAVALGLTTIRNGPLGRRLAAMKDSPAACATLGLDTRALKLQVFALSSAIAGFGGAMLAMWSESSVGVNQYALIEGGAQGGLPVLLVAVIGGVTSVYGALFGAILLVAMPIIGLKATAAGNLGPVPIGWVAKLMNMLPGLVGISVAESPDGAIAQIASARSEVAEALARRRESRDESSGRLVPERLVGQDRMSESDVAELDSVLGLSWGRDDLAEVRS